MKTRFGVRLLPLLLAFALLFPACNKMEAATMNLMKAEGTVAVADDKGQEVPIVENLGLYSGYDMATRLSSYAWINLDQVKLAKMDEQSEIEIRKDGKHLEIRLKSGSVFFNVTEPLAEDETLDIRTSDLLVGIRGTCGWVSAEGGSSVHILEGTVAASLSDGTGEVPVSAGETGRLAPDGSVTVEKFTALDVPGFVEAELEEDSALAKSVLDASGLDVLNPPPEGTLPEDESPENSLPPEAALAYDAYAGVLNHYLTEGVRESDTYWQEDCPPDICYPLMSTYRSYYSDQAPGDFFLYAYYDLNRDGREELLVGWEDAVFAVYTFNGAQAEMAVACANSRYSTITLCTDGSIAGAQVRVAGDPENGSVEEIRLLRIGADGSTLEEFSGGWEWLDSHPAVTDIPWQPIGGGEGGSGGAVDFSLYAGRYSCAATGTAIEIADSWGSWILSTPRPGDPAHLDTYGLEGGDGRLEVRDSDHVLLLTITHTDGGLLVENTGMGGEFDHIIGEYVKS